MKKRRSLTISLLALALLICVSSGLVLRGYRREQASRELILALKSNDTGRAQDALRVHADPNVRDPGDEMPSLHRYLLTLWQQMRGIKPPAHETGSTALRLAVYHGNRVLVEALLARGAKDENDTLKDDAIVERAIPLLLYAVERSNSAIVEAHLKHGWNANTADATEYSALHYVNDVVTVKLLLAFGADIHSKSIMGTSTLDGVLGMGHHPDVVEALLDAGAKIDVQDNRSMTPLMVAASCLHPALVQALL